MYYVVCYKYHCPIQSSLTRIVRDKEERGTVKECPVMDYLLMGIGGYVDEQLASNRKLGGIVCIIRKKEEVENASWLLRKSGKGCTGR